MTVRTLKISGKSFVVVPEKDFRELTDRLKEYQAEDQEDAAVVRKRMRNRRGVIPLPEIKKESNR